MCVCVCVAYGRGETAQELRVASVDDYSRMCEGQLQTHCARLRIPADIQVYILYTNILQNSFIKKRVSRDITLKSLYKNSRGILFVENNSCLIGTRTHDLINE